MNVFVKEMDDTYGPCVESFINTAANPAALPLFLFPMPEDVHDTHTRQAYTLYTLYTIYIVYTLYIL
jgi:hypothetical protein